MINANQINSMMKFLQDNSSNPVIGNIITMINNKDSKALEDLARNLAKEKGVDIDAMYNQITRK